MSVRITTKIWESSLSKVDLLVLLALADCADDDGVAWPKNTYLAWKTGLSRQTIAATFTAFREKRYLVGSPSQGEVSTRYQILTENLPTKMPWSAKKGRLPKDSGREGTLSISPTGSKDPVNSSDRVGGYPVNLAEGPCQFDARCNKEETSLETSVNLSSASRKVVDKRHTPFREEIQKQHQSNTGEPCAWDGGEAGQLGRVLKRYPTLTLWSFRKWLENYWESDQGIRMGPAVAYLAKIEKFMNGPRDAFWKQKPSSGASGLENMADIGEVMKRQLKR